MNQPLPAVIRRGHIELLQPLSLPEGTELLVRIESQAATLKKTESAGSEENHFWLAAGQESLSDIWDHPEDDAYAALLDA